MQEVFEKIINKLEKQKEYYKDIRKNTHCSVTETSECDSCRADHFLDARLRCVDDITEIVKQAAEQYNNGWISCSERLPEKYNRVLAYTDAGGYYIAHVNGCGKFVCTAECVSTVIENSDVIAWQPLPAPYQPHQREKKK